VRGMNNLVLLRATDAPVYGGQHMARVQNNCSLSSTVAIVTAGLNKIQQLVEASYSTSEPSLSTLAEPSPSLTHSDK
jgi:hypothetical protein